MRLLFSVIFLLVHLEKSHSSTPSEFDLTVEKLKSILPSLDNSWNSPPLTVKKHPEDETQLKVSSFYFSEKEISLNSKSYKYAYLEATFKKSNYSESFFSRCPYSKSSTFLSFLEGHSVTKLNPDSSQDFRILSELSSSLSPEEASECSHETLSYFQYFPENEESYTVTFIR